MECYKIGNAVVRVHGKCDPDKLKAATERFMKQAIAASKKALKTGRKDENNEC